MYIGHIVHGLIILIAGFSIGFFALFSLTRLSLFYMLAPYYNLLLPRATAS